MLKSTDVITPEQYEYERHLAQCIALETLFADLLQFSTNSYINSEELQKLFNDLAQVTLSNNTNIPLIINSIEQSEPGIITNPVYAAIKNIFLSYNDVDEIFSNLFKLSTQDIKVQHKSDPNLHHDFYFLTNTPDIECIILEEDKLGEGTYGKVKRGVVYFTDKNKENQVIVAKIERVIEERLYNPNYIKEDLILFKESEKSLYQARQELFSSIERNTQTSKIAIVTADALGIPIKKKSVTFTKYHRGNDLYAVIKSGSLSKVQALDIAKLLMQQLDSSIHNVGTQKFIHMDIKPENIRVDIDTNTQKVQDLQFIDFGLALLLQPNATEITLKKTTYGTPAFMESNLFAENNTTVTQKSDIYSAGLILRYNLDIKNPITLKMLDPNPNNRPTAQEVLNILASINLEPSEQAKLVHIKDPELTFDETTALRFIIAAYQSYEKCLALINAFDTKILSKYYICSNKSITAKIRNLELCDTIINSLDKLETQFCTGAETDKILNTVKLDILILETSILYYDLYTTYIIDFAENYPMLAQMPDSYHEQLHDLLEELTFTALYGNEISISQSFLLDINNRVDNFKQLFADHIASITSSSTHTSRDTVVTKEASSIEAVVENTFATTPKAYDLQYVEILYNDSVTPEHLKATYADQIPIIINILNYPDGSNQAFILGKSFSKETILNPLSHFNTAVTSKDTFKNQLIHRTFREFPDKNTLTQTYLDNNKKTLIFSVKDNGNKDFYTYQREYDKIISVSINAEDEQTMQKIIEDNFAKLPNHVPIFVASSNSKIESGFWFIKQDNDFSSLQLNKIDNTLTNSLLPLKPSNKTNISDYKTIYVTDLLSQITEDINKQAGNLLSFHSHKINDVFTIGDIIHHINLDTPPTLEKLDTNFSHKTPAIVTHFTGNNNAALTEIQYIYCKKNDGSNTNILIPLTGNFARYTMELKTYAANINEIITINAKDAIPLVYNLIENAHGHCNFFDILVSNTSQNNRAEITSCMLGSKNQEIGAVNTKQIYYDLDLSKTTEEIIQEIDQNISQQLLPTILRATQQQFMYLETDRYNAEEYVLNDNMPTIIKTTKDQNSFIFFQEYKSPNLANIKNIIGDKIPAIIKLSTPQNGIKYYCIGKNVHLNDVETEITNADLIAKLTNMEFSPHKLDTIESRTMSKSMTNSRSFLNAQYNPLSRLKLMLQDDKRSSSLEESMFIDRKLEILAKKSAIAATLTQKHSQYTTKLMSLMNHKIDDANFIHKIAELDAIAAEDNQDIDKLKVEIYDLVVEQSLHIPIPEYYYKLPHETIPSKIDKNYFTEELASLSNDQPMYTRHTNDSKTNLFKLIFIDDSYCTKYYFIPGCQSNNRNITGIEQIQPNIATLTFEEELKNRTLRFSLGALDETKFPIMLCKSSIGYTINFMSNPLNYNLSLLYLPENTRYTTPNSIQLQYSLTTPTIIVTIKNNTKQYSLLVNKQMLSLDAMLVEKYLPRKVHQNNEVILLEDVNIQLYRHLHKVSGYTAQIIKDVLITDVEITSYIDQKLNSRPNFIMNQTNDIDNNAIVNKIYQIIQKNSGLVYAVQIPPKQTELQSVKDSIPIFKVNTEPTVTNIKELIPDYVPDVFACSHNSILYVGKKSLHNLDIKPLTHGYRIHYIELDKITPRNIDVMKATFSSQIPIIVHGKSGSEYKMIGRNANGDIIVTKISNSLLLDKINKAKPPANNIKVSSNKPILNNLKPKDLPLIVKDKNNYFIYGIDITGNVQESPLIPVAAFNAKKNRKDPNMLQDFHSLFTNEDSEIKNSKDNIFLNELLCANGWHVEHSELATCINRKLSKKAPNELDTDFYTGLGKINAHTPTVKFEEYTAAINNINSLQENERYFIQDLKSIEIISSTVATPKKLAPLKALSNTIHEGVEQKRLQREKAEKINYDNSKASYEVLIKINNKLHLGINSQDIKQMLENNFSNISHESITNDIIFLNKTIDGCKKNSNKNFQILQKICQNVLIYYIRGLLLNTALYKANSVSDQKINIAKSRDAIFEALTLNFNESEINNILSFTDRHDHTMYDVCMLSRENSQPTPHYINLMKKLQEKFANDKNPEIKKVDFLTSLMTEHKINADEPNLGILAKTLQLGSKVTILAEIQQLKAIVNLLKSIALKSNGSGKTLFSRKDTKKNKQALMDVLDNIQAINLSGRDRKLIGKFFANFSRNCIYYPDPAEYIGFLEEKIAHIEQQSPKNKRDSDINAKPIINLGRFLENTEIFALNRNMLSAIRDMYGNILDITDETIENIQDHFSIIRPKMESNPQLDHAIVFNQDVVVSKNIDKTGYFAGQLWDTMLANYLECNIVPKNICIGSILNHHNFHWTSLISNFNIYEEKLYDIKSTLEIEKNKFLFDLYNNVILVLSLPIPLPNEFTEENFSSLVEGINSLDHIVQQKFYTKVEEMLFTKKVANQFCAIADELATYARDYPNNTKNDYFRLIDMEAINLLYNDELKMQCEELAELANDLRSSPSIFLIDLHNFKIKLNENSNVLNVVNLDNICPDFSSMDDYNEFLLEQYQDHKIASLHQPDSNIPKEYKEIFFNALSRGIINDPMNNFSLITNFINYDQSTLEHYDSLNPGNSNATYIQDAKHALGSLINHSNGKCSIVAKQCLQQVGNTCGEFSALNTILVGCLQTQNLPKLIFNSNGVLNNHDIATELRSLSYRDNANQCLAIKQLLTVHKADFVLPESIHNINEDLIVDDATNPDTSDQSNYIDVMPEKNFVVLVKSLRDVLDAYDPTEADNFKKYELVCLDDSIDLPDRKDLFAKYIDYISWIDYDELEDVYTYNLDFYNIAESNVFTPSSQVVKTLENPLDSGIMPKLSSLDKDLKFKEEFKSENIAWQQALDLIKENFPREDINNLPNDSVIRISKSLHGIKLFITTTLPDPIPNDLGNAIIITDEHIAYFVKNNILLKNSIAIASNVLTDAGIPEESNVDYLYEYPPTNKSDKLSTLISCLNVQSGLNIHSFSFGKNKDGLLYVVCIANDGDVPSGAEGKFKKCFIRYLDKDGNYLDNITDLKSYGVKITGNTQFTIDGGAPSPIDLEILNTLGRLKEHFVRNAGEVNIYNPDLDLDSNKHYVLQDLHSGQDLKKTLKSTKASLTEEVRTELAVKLVESIHQLHTLGYIHCDIKADNFVVDMTDPNNIKVAAIDFGLSKKIDPNNEFFISQFAGNAQYRAPESMFNIYSSNSDVFSLGALLKFNLKLNLPIIDQMLDPNPLKRPSLSSVLTTLAPTQYPDNLNNIRQLDATNVSNIGNDLEKFYVQFKDNSAINKINSDRIDEMYYNQVMPSDSQLIKEMKSIRAFYKNHKPFEHCTSINANEQYELHAILNNLNDPNNAAPVVIDEPENELDINALLRTFNANLDNENFNFSSISSEDDDLDFSLDLNLETEEVQNVNSNALALDTKEQKLTYITKYTKDYKWLFNPQEFRTLMQVLNESFFADPEDDLTEELDAALAIIQDHTIPMDHLDTVNAIFEHIDVQNFPITYPKELYYYDIAAEVFYKISNLQNLENFFDLIKHKLDDLHKQLRDDADHPFYFSITEIKNLWDRVCSNTNNNQNNIDLVDLQERISLEVERLDAAYLPFKQNFYLTAYLQEAVDIFNRNLQSTDTPGIVEEFKHLLNSIYSYPENIDLSSTLNMKSILTSLLNIAQDQSIHAIKHFDVVEKTIKLLIYNINVRTTDHEAINISDELDTCITTIDAIYAKAIAEEQKELSLENSRPQIEQFFIEFSTNLETANQISYYQAKALKILFDKLYTLENISACAEHILERFNRVLVVARETISSPVITNLYSSANQIIQRCSVTDNAQNSTVISDFINFCDKAIEHALQNDPVNRDNIILKEILTTLQSSMQSGSQIEQINSIIKINSMIAKLNDIGSNLPNIIDILRQFTVNNFENPYMAAASPPIKQSIDQLLNKFYIPLSLQMPKLAGKSSAEINRFVVGNLNKFVAAVLTPIRMKVEQAEVTTKTTSSTTINTPKPGSI